MASRGHKAGDVGPRVARDGARLLHSGGEDPGCQSPVSPHAACAHAGSWDGLSQRSRLKGRSRSTVQHDCREEGAMSRDERGGVDIFSTRNASHVNNRWSGKGRRAACPCIASLCMLAFLFLWITREVDWGEESFVTVSGQQVSTSIFLKNKEARNAGILNSVLLQSVVDLCSVCLKAVRKWYLCCA
ncbi:unnamed protein product [Ostreobium quekettii]|uniref:Uncharacterized protein n=1 Tax=Ostreobium quekettii TaxID=121088 RepID=A0A8S1J0P8_9CHLO|nr:unnamed protein product [Ostreobium quekettii]